MRAGGLGHGGRGRGSRLIGQCLSPYYFLLTTFSLLLSGPPSSLLLSGLPSSLLLTTFYFQVWGCPKKGTRIRGDGRLLLSLDVNLGLQGNHQRQGRVCNPRAAGNIFESARRGRVGDHPLPVAPRQRPRVHRPRPADDAARLDPRGRGGRGRPGRGGQAARRVRGQVQGGDRPRGRGPARVHGRREGRRRRRAAPPPRHGERPRRGRPRGKRGGRRMGQARQGGRPAHLLRGHPAAHAPQPARGRALGWSRPPRAQVEHVRGRRRGRAQGVRFHDPHRRECEAGLRRVRWRPVLG